MYMMLDVPLALKVAAARAAQLAMAPEQWLEVRRRGRWRRLTIDEREPASADGQTRSGRQLHASAAAAVLPATVSCAGSCVLGPHWKFDEHGAVARELHLEPMHMQALHLAAPLLQGRNWRVAQAARNWNPACLQASGWLILRNRCESQAL
jgi:hypothetical protein